MSVKHKISGFFSALMIAIISYFVLFFFFPEYSQKYLGTSIKSDKQARQTVSATTSELLEKADPSVFDRIGDFFKK